MYAEEEVVIDKSLGEESGQVDLADCGLLDE
jgi:hypothetical protein